MEGGTHERQQTGGGATQTHRTREPHQEGQGRAQQTRRRGTARQERQPEQREQGTRMEGNGMAWPASPLATGCQGNPCSTGIRCLPQPRWAVCAKGAGAHQGQTSREGEKDIWWTAGTTCGEQGTWAPHTQKHSEAGYGRPVDRGAWTAKTVKRPRQQPAHPQYTNYWAPLMRKRHTMPHSA